MRLVIHSIWHNYNSMQLVPFSDNRVIIRILGRLRSRVGTLLVLVLIVKGYSSIY